MTAALLAAAARDDGSSIAVSPAGLVVGLVILVVAVAVAWDLRRQGRIPGWLYAVVAAAAVVVFLVLGFDISLEE